MSEYKDDYLPHGNDREHPDQIIHPFDDFEIGGLRHLRDHPVNSYRAAGLQFLAFYDQVLSFVMEYENPRLAIWVIAIASGRTTLTGGIAQTELAQKMGLTKAAVSKCVKTVQARFGNSIAGIEAMPGQRTSESCSKFAALRNKQIKSQNAN